MGKLEPIDGQSTKWEGLWWHPENMYFSSAIINLADLRKFKGRVRLYVRKNIYYNKGENNRPNYMFSLRAVDSEDGKLLEVKSDNDDNIMVLHCNSDGEWYADDGTRMYTYDEVQYAINGATEDAVNGYDDNIVEDYL